MPKVKPPRWSPFVNPFPNPLPPQTACRNLAAIELSNMDSDDTLALSLLSSLMAEIVNGENGANAWGSTLADAATVLADIDADGSADTLADEIAAAIAQDQALSDLADAVALASGAPAVPPAPDISIERRPRL